jgi:hypothetical protein
MLTKRSWSGKLYFSSFRKLLASWSNQCRLQYNLDKAVGDLQDMGSHTSSQAKVFGPQKSNEGGQYFHSEKKNVQEAMDDEDIEYDEDSN